MSKYKAYCRLEIRALLVEGERSLLVQLQEAAVMTKV